MASSKYRIINVNWNINICFRGEREKEEKIEPCWVRREGSMAFRDLRTVERTTFFCLKMESSSSWLLLVLVLVLMLMTDLIAGGDNLKTGRVGILGRKKIDDDGLCSDVVIQKTRAPIIT